MWDETVIEASKGIWVGRVQSWSFSVFFIPTPGRLVQVKSLPVPNSKEYHQTRSFNRQETVNHSLNSAGIDRICRWFSIYINLIVSRYPTIILCVSILGTPKLRRLSSCWWLLPAGCACISLPGFCGQAWQKLPMDPSKNWFSWRVLDGCLWLFNNISNIYIVHSISVYIYIWYRIYIYIYIYT